MMRIPPKCRSLATEKLKGTRKYLVLGQESLYLRGHAQNPRMLNGYSLAAGRYKSQIAEKAPDEDPDQLVTEVLESRKRS